MARPSYPAVASTLALVVSLSGGAYAFSLPDNSVGTRHLKAGAVKTSKIANGAVTNPKIADDAITTSKIANGAVTNPKIADDAITTSKIANGEVTNIELANDAVTSSKIEDFSVTDVHLDSSAKRVYNLNRKRSADISMAPNQATTVSVDCDPGQVAVGGGFYRSHTDVEIFWSYAQDANTWTVSGHPGAATGRNLLAHVVCVAG